MRILLSNDDGYFAPGLAILAEHLSKLAEVVVVAPHERSRHRRADRAMQQLAHDGTLPGPVGVQADLSRGEDLAHDRDQVAPRRELLEQFLGRAKQLGPW